ncbi:MAG: peptide deformylase [Planctomycetes bacterium]|nr:peptide deformylase [Planctomycetota bacterium]
MKIVHYPHPSLRRRARPLTSIDQKIHSQVRQMFELMYEAKGLGLAATQVELPFQLLIMNLTADPNQPEREEAYINPVVVDQSGSVEDEEGCLSLPGLYKNVRRAKTVKVHAYNLKGEAVEITAQDMAARVLQHEIDHLQGILFIDRLGPIARLASRNSVKDFERRFRQAQARGEIPPNTEIEKALAALEAQA